MSLDSKINAYYITAVGSLIFALVGFSYNAWRLEISEDNANIRTASFQVLIELAAFEQVLYAAHYDKDSIAGNPRKGWIKVGLIDDLSVLIDNNVEHEAKRLKTLWSHNWELISTDKTIINTLNKQIDTVRTAIKKRLRQLE